MECRRPPHFSEPILSILAILYPHLTPSLCTSIKQNVLECNYICTFLVVPEPSEIFSSLSVEAKAAAVPGWYGDD